MKKTIQNFSTKDFYTALSEFFRQLNIPVDYLAEEPARPVDILTNTYKADHPAFQLMDDVYFLGMVDDATFEGNSGLDPAKIESDYEGILIFGVTLSPRDNGLLPTRGQLAAITRSFNREFHYTPVVVIFKYADSSKEYIAFANAERLKYKQQWREGEKAGKVSLLRDIDLTTPHSGHLRILQELAITRRGKKGINSFAALYGYWQEVFNVSLLNKKFYEELSNWYFWAVQEVSFPSEPTIHSLFEETGSNDGAKLQEAIQEHKAKNVIRLLTRFLFVWFIKEKKLIPEELFDQKYLKEEILKDLSPFQPTGAQGSLFQLVNIKSSYYKAILQNLFFATLNQEMGKRGFRNDKQHMNVTNLLRYESCFKNGQKFVELVESVVPFMNGGLFECLDKPHPTKKGPRGGDVIIYKDGFSDRKDNPLKVPDYLFFGLESEVDLSSVIGIKNKKTKQAAVKGLINIFNSYKFTIAENTPIEEDIALDPELLGKVFENLLASYNPETKTTARKQTGSFYTPREIVNYMVDESLIAYLKNAVTTWDMADDELDAKLHQLLSFDPLNPFAGSPIEKEIINALDHCTILDPACGSGAFPMGVLQKMVHVLHKIDPQNIEWKQRQISRVDKAIASLEEIDDPNFRQKSIKELEAQKKDIEAAFADNELDYGRKLFLIENCIYGVDIQPIAVQISKLRFFISLVVDQKVNKDRANFGILPLPNLETKFVAANTLIGIEKPEKQGNLFENKEIKRLEQQLKDVRHRIFSAKTPKTKRKLRDEDQALREKMGKLLIADGWENKTAKQLAGWDPYDQNASSDFFDPEWMFGVKDGFDVVIGNPPYKQVPKGIFSDEQFPFSEGKDKGKQNLYKIFVEESKIISKRKTGTACMIVQSSLLCDLSSKHTREFLLRETTILEIIEFPKIAPTKEGQVFENVLQGTCIYRFLNKKPTHNGHFNISINNDVNTLSNLDYEKINQGSIFSLYPATYYIPLVRKGDFIPMNDALNNSSPLKRYIHSISQGDINLTASKDHFTLENTGIKLYRGKNVQRFYLVKDVEEYVSKGFKSEKIDKNKTTRFLVCQEITGTTDKYRLHFAITDKNEDFLFGHTANKLKVQDNENIKALAVILNSHFLDWLFRKTSTNNHVMGYEIEQFPIPNKYKDIAPILEQQYQMLSFLNKNKSYFFTLFENIMNGMVFQLYFPDHMQKKQIDILQFVEKDLAEVMQNRDFDQLPNNEKEEIINQLHARWTHPDSEVRNRIKLFAVRSPDILKPILESR